MFKASGIALGVIAEFHRFALTAIKLEAKSFITKFQLVGIIDHGKKTDLVVADDNNYYWIQVKSIDSKDKTTKVKNKWQGVKIDYVIFFPAPRSGVHNACISRGQKTTECSRPHPFEADDMDSHTQENF